MKNPISIEELNQLLTNDETKAQALSDYFYYFEETPFSGEYKLKETIVLISEKHSNTEVEGFIGSSLKLEAMDKANNDARNKRNKRFEDIKNEPNRTIILSEGDSWFQYPKFKLLGIGFTKEVKDIIDHLIDDDRFAVKSLDAGGDILRNIYHSREYFKEIEEIKPKVFLLSAGGNDFFAVFSKMLKSNETQTISEWLGLNFRTELEVLKIYYISLLTELVEKYPDLKIIIHGYDYLIPRVDGNWIGKPMVDIGILMDTSRKELITYIMDEFNKIQHEVADLPHLKNNVFKLDIRNCVPQHKSFWHDEIHPNDEGFGFVAEKFKDLIVNISQPSI